LFALQQEFTVTGNYPGCRTKTCLNQGTKDAVQSVLWNAAGKITDWHDRDGLTGSFQLTTASERSWIHTDHHNTWAGVLYLTPDAPISGGTGLFRYRASGARYAHEIQAYEAQDLTKWEMVDRIGNIYNRLILYRSNMFHSSLDYFGSGPDDGRLFQLFFLTTQY
jgi:hypothetical protein